MSNSRRATDLPVVVVGSANADIYVEIDRLPREGETIAARGGQTLAGGKGANQAACAGKLSHPTYFIGQIARSANVPVILDAGGMEGPIPENLLKCIDIFSPNETELERLTGASTNTIDQVIEAAAKCHEMGVKQVLVKLGEKGSVLVTEGLPPIIQPAILAPMVLDTTGAGDTFTAAFAVALVEGNSVAESLKFAAAAASLCIQVKGAIPSMPERNTVLQLLKSAYSSAD